jgi:thiol:disulfide interchange protein DsbD
MDAMLARLLFLALLLGIARASDPISAPALGASLSVAQPHVTAELIPETTAAQEGQPFDVALHLHMDAGWHTYWINPGDAGLATKIVWTLPNGFTAGPIQWPTPEKHNMGPLVTYGYGGDVYLLTTITPPKSDLPQHFEIKAKASWLVCQEECIPGKAELTLPMDSGLMNLRLPQENTDLFTEARARMPVANTRWDVRASYYRAGSDVLLLKLEEKATESAPLGHLAFFPEMGNVLDTQLKSTVQRELSNSDVTAIFNKITETLPPGKSVAADPANAAKPAVTVLEIALAQNGEKPNELSGVLVSDRPLIGDSKAVYIANFSVSSVATAAPGAPVPSGGSTSASSATGGSPQASASTSNSGDGHRPPLQTASADQPILLGVLSAAFIGGLILNLMPCVLPVLSLKVFSLMKHAGENAKTAWIQGVAFTAGVVISFWFLAGLLIALRTAGNHLGWGFQMQDPRFVLGLILLFFILGLNLFGLFELGASLVGLDAKAAGKLHGTASSFGNGALATLAATPCTAPFMGSALGFAAQQPAYISLLIFTFLALGMATPYLLLTIFPGALKFVPKPGAWMEAFKQFMGFLLMATVIFLVYVFGALTGPDQVPWLLFVLLLAGIASWIYGKWCTPINSTPVRFTAYVLALGIFGGAVFWGVDLAKAAPPLGTAAATTEGWQPWTQDAVDAALAKGQPVFVDFTAAWCLSCKVNERVALGTDDVKKAFADKKVALFKADWTQSDPAISQTLQKFNRDGVPLYLLYSPTNPTTPQVLPEVLTPGIVLDAVKNL